MPAKRIFIFFLVIGLLALLSVYYPSIQQLTGQATKQTEYPTETAILSRVVDGDTIVLNNSVHVRLLGINTPEKNMPFSNESKKFLKQFENKTITLERDFEDKDKYGRSLRYIFYENKFLNQEILELGLANTYYLSGLKYETNFKNAETQAKNLELGIWTKSGELCAECIILKELNYTEEFFTIRNTCTFSCELSGWFVKDAGRNTFYLESMNANSEKTYESNKEVWNNDGDRFFMFDKSGYLALFYEYDF